MIGKLKSWAVWIGAALAGLLAVYVLGRKDGASGQKLKQAKAEAKGAAKTGRVTGRAKTTGQHIDEIIKESQSEPARRKRKTGDRVQGGKWGLLLAAGLLSLACLGGTWACGERVVQQWPEIAEPPVMPTPVLEPWELIVGQAVNATTVEAIESNEAKLKQAVQARDKVLQALRRFWLEYEKEKEAR